MTNETTPDAVEHGPELATDPLDGLEQLRRIIDEQPEPAPESVMLGLDYCYAEWVAERARHAEEVERLRRERQAFGMRIEELETREDDLAVELAEVRRRMCRAFGVSESATWAELESLATTRGNGEEAYD